MAKKKVEEITENVNVNENINIENLQEKPTEHTAATDTIEEQTIAKKLLSLYNIQLICSKIDQIRVIRGELPNEVRDLEDAHEGMLTRIAKYKEDVDELQQKITNQDLKIKESLTLIKRYEDQQNNVRNNREYDSLTKEIEFQKLEIQVAEKYKTKFAGEIVVKTDEITQFEAKLEEIADILQQKKNELDDIIADTEKEEIELLEKYDSYKKNVDQRLLIAFERIRNGARNGLAIVQIDREACGGCFSMIPPQRQLDIRLHKKIIVCEACGRIFIDKQLVENQEAEA